MNLWHLTPDAPRHPDRPCPGQVVELWIGTWPIETGQRVHVACHVLGRDGRHEAHEVEASWHHNQGPNSYWCTRLGPFADGDTVEYRIAGRRGLGPVTMSGGSFRVGPKIHLAMLWHQHQPFYLEHGGPRELYRFPWVRLHAIRDYYAMAALVAEYPAVHLTMNLVPSLLAQLDGYCERGAVDRALRLTQTPAARLRDDERETVLSTFFDADWHNQIYVHSRYKELFERRATGGSFAAQDLTDLQMWFNLAWFAPEFLRGDVRLHDGAVVNLQRFVERGRGFTAADIRTMLEVQYAIMRNVVPLHRTLQEAGQIEVSTTPFYHPILPLIHDTDVATIDRPGAVLPRRFRAPRDAQAQVDDAASFYADRFGIGPRGMWPAEGAVGQSVVRYFAAAGVGWIASDEGVLQRSGRWGYRTDDPNVLCQPYRAESDAGAVSIFFRDRTLSDSIGFKYQAFVDQAQAARDFLAKVKQRLAERVSDGGNRVATIILDGDNAWGAYRQAARPFLHALYQTLSADTEIKTVTFSEYLEGNAARVVSAHPLDAHPKVYDLYHGSWIDEWGSAPGVDLGTWVGEDEENRGWELLGEARARIDAAHVDPASHPKAFAALYAAEGSDWFWWFGADQESGYDDVFDDLFRGHLRAVYRGIDRPAPRSLAAHIVPHAVVWTFTCPVRTIQPRDRLIIRTNCPGILRWSADGWQTLGEAPLTKAGGAMAGLHSYSLTLDALPADAQTVEFTFTCTECGCSGDAPCCAGASQRVQIAAGPSNDLAGKRHRPSAVLEAEAMMETNRRVLISGGYGEVGRRIAALLAADYPDCIVVAGRDAAKAAALARSIGYGVRGLHLDIHDPTSVDAALDDVDVVVNCIDQREPYLLRAAIARGLGYTDMTAAYALWSIAVAMHEEACETGARVLIGAGLTPGIASVMARAGAQRVGALHAVHVSLLLSLGDAFGPATLKYLMSAVARPLRVIENGGEREVWSFTEPRFVNFPAPLGRRGAYRAPFSDQFFFPRTLGVPTASSRLALEPEWVTRVIALMVRLGATSLLRQARVRWAILRAVDFVHARHAGRDRFALVVEVEGPDTRARFALSGRDQSQATATSAALIARSLCEHEIVRPGVWLPEQIIDPPRFFERLAQRGLHVVADGDDARNFDQPRTGRLVESRLGTP